MELLQNILVYITVAVAVAYMAKKFLIPKSVFAGKKKTKSCGNDDCGCH